MTTVVRTDVRLEGLTLPVSDMNRSIEFYEKLGFEVTVRALPEFAMLRVGGVGGGTIGLLAETHQDGAEASHWTHEDRAGIHVELEADDLDGLYEQLTAQGIDVASPPHDEPWERSMYLYDPDGFTVEFAQGARGANEPG